MLEFIVTLMNHGYMTINQYTSVLQWIGNTLLRFVPENFKLNISRKGYAHSQKSQAVLLTRFQKKGENVNAASHCKVLLKFRNAIQRKRRNLLIRWILSHHGNEPPHTFRVTYSQNCENEMTITGTPSLQLTILILSRVISNCLLHLKTTFVENVSQMTHKLNQK